MIEIFTRRRFLGALVSAGAVLTAAGGGGLALHGWSPSVAELRVLSDSEYRTLRALASALVPRGGPFPTGADDVDLARRFDVFLSGEPVWNVSDLRKALWLLEWGPVLLDRRGRTFSRLSESERLDHFMRWRTSERDVLRQASTAFAKFVSLVFYDTPAVWPGIGYDGPVTGVRDA